MLYVDHNCTHCIFWYIIIHILNHHGKHHPDNVSVFYAYNGDRNQSYRNGSSLLYACVSPSSFSSCRLQNQKTDDFYVVPNRGCDISSIPYGLASYACVCSSNSTFFLCHLQSQKAVVDSYACSLPFSFSLCCLLHPRNQKMTVDSYACSLSSSFSLYHLQNRKNALNQSHLIYQILNGISLFAYACSFPSSSSRSPYQLQSRKMMLTSLHDDACACSCVWNVSWTLLLRSS